MGFLGFGNKKHQPSDADKMVNALTDIVRDIAREVRKGAEEEKKDKREENR